MSSLGNLFKDTGHRLSGSGRAFIDSVKNFSLKNPNAAEFVPTPPGLVERGARGYLKGFVGAPLAVGLKIIDVTAAFFLTPVKWLASAPGSYFKAFPRFAPISVAAGAAMGIGSWFTNRRSAMLEQNFAAAQQDMAMQAMAAQPAYGLQPGEFTQNVAPLMREGGQAEGHTDRLAAARAASAQAPKTADLSAL